MSRGLTGTIGDKWVVASPIYKQHFCLETGKCIEDDSVQLKSWQVENNGGKLFITDMESIAA